MVKKSKTNRPQAKILYQFVRKNMTLVSRPRRLPNGHRINLEMLVHPGAVCIVPVLNPKHIVLMRQYRPVVNSYLYELPAGTLDNQESPLRCAQRELMEETGYTAKRWSRQGKIFPLPAYSNEQIIIYKASSLTLTQSAREADEVIEVQPTTLRGVRKLFSAGKIIDAKTICALTFCRIL